VEKECSKCGGGYPMDAVVCVPSEHVFEERHYLTWIGITLPIAMVFDQGKAFFDFRISNTYVERYRRSQRTPARPAE
jgi:hypothetical protein